MLCRSSPGPRGSGRGPHSLTFRQALALALPLGLSLCSASAEALPRLILAISSGTAYSVPLNLTIEQAGQSTLEMTAHYATRPFQGSPYYALRLALPFPGGAWEAELVHHKLYLDDTTPDVPHLEATHGYNYILLSRSWKPAAFEWRAGVGGVIVHMEGIVRGQPVQVRDGLFGSDYRLAGPAAQLGAGRPIDLGRGFFVAPEIKLTGAYARVPIEDGRVTMPNLALHALLGIGYAF